MKRAVLSLLAICMMVVSAACGQDSTETPSGNEGNGAAVESQSMQTPSDPEVDEAGQTDDIPPGDSTKISEQDGVDWSAITAQGLDEELFLDGLDTQDLETVAATIQTLVDQEIAAEAENPEILLTEGWTRVFQDELYRQVIAMGDRAQKPLYYIIFKSPNTGMYEYICAAALYELSGLNFENEDGTLTWSTSKDFLEQFNQAICSEP